MGSNSTKLIHCLFCQFQLKKRLSGDAPCSKDPLYVTAVEGNESLSSHPSRFPTKEMDTNILQLWPAWAMSSWVGLSPASLSLHVCKEMKHIISLLTNLVSGPPSLRLCFSSVCDPLKNPVRKLVRKLLPGGGLKPALECFRRACIGLFHLLIIQSHRRALIVSWEVSLNLIASEGWRVKFGNVQGVFWAFLMMSRGKF